MRGRRLEREIQAYRDGELPAERRARVSSLLRDDPEVAGALRRSEALGAAIRHGWNDGPPAPAAAELMRAIAPALARIDRELEAPPAAARISRGLTELLRPLRIPALAAAAAAAAAAFWLISSAPSTSPTQEFPFGRRTAAPANSALHAASFADATVYDLGDEDGPVMVFEGDEGATIIWVLDDPDDLSWDGPEPQGWV